MPVGKLNTHVKKIKSYTKSELAHIYGVAGATFKKWLLQLNDLNLQPNFRILTPKRVAYIFEEFGVAEEAKLRLTFLKWKR